MPPAHLEGRRIWCRDAKPHTASTPEHCRHDSTDEPASLQTTKPQVMLHCQDDVLKLSAATKPALLLIAKSIN